MFGSFQIREVKADSTFGKTNIGGTKQLMDANTKRSYLHTLTEDGTITKITIYMNKSVNDVHVKACIYNSTPGALETIATEEITVTSTTAAWYDLEFSSGQFLSADDYRITFWVDQPLYLYYDSVADIYKDKVVVYGDEPTNPFGTVAKVRPYSHSIYATYTTGQDLTFSLFENFNAWDSTSKTMEISNTLFQAFNTWESMAFNKEVGFKLYEPFNLWSYLASNKEQSFTFYENFDLWSSITMASEGVALDLYFTFFEAFNPYASLATVLEEELTLDDVYGLAALAFIMAIVGICLAVAFKKK